MADRRENVTPSYLESACALKRKTHSLKFFGRVNVLRPDRAGSFLFRIASCFPRRRIQSPTCERPQGRERR